MQSGAGDDLYIYFVWKLQISEIHRDRKKLAAARGRDRRNNDFLTYILVVVVAAILLLRRQGVYTQAKLKHMALQPHLCQDWDYRGAPPSLMGLGFLWGDQSLPALDHTKL